ncbi:MAG TPA: SDR family oxidoreductase [Streptosporangiaceae bacterium]|jgi:NAD(P)-dependent dehydrogenase (short-subunit alcohol dehydrogenase family)
MSISTVSRVVILGGTSGIGLATAKAAAAAGASVVVVSRDRASVESALAELPPGSAGHAVDASSAEDLAAFFDIVGEFDHFAYTAAGPLVSISLADYTADKGRAFFETRVVAALDAMRLAVPHIRPGGSITMTSGTAAFRGGAGWFLGSAASGAILSAARALAVELAPIRVNVVAPGVVRSPVWSAMSEADREAMYDTVGRSLPLGRVAEVEDVAKAYFQLMDQDYATGTVSVIDGGTLLV